MRCTRSVFNKTACSICFFLLFSGCATAPEVVYVREAQQVMTQALDPIMLEPVKLENDIHDKYSRYFSADAADNLIKVIQTEIANTRRFSKVMLTSNEGDTYIIEPGIDDIKESLVNIQTDPTRKLFTIKARVRLDVFFINQKNQKELVKSFYDERKLDNRISAKTALTVDQKQEYHLRTITIAFRAAADRLGNGFNPGYEMGAVSRINGRTVFVRINTSKLRMMPKKQQAVCAAAKNHGRLWPSAAATRKSAQDRLKDAIPLGGVSLQAAFRPDHVIRQGHLPLDRHLRPR